MEQRTDDWFTARAGKITASRIGDVMAFAKKGGAPLKARKDYAHQLAAERLTGKPRKQIKAAALEWGQRMEPEAVAAYEAKIGDFIELVGFVTHPQHSFIGASPDFLVGLDGGGEIKCPESSEVHLTTLLEGLPQEHIEQIQTGMWVTGRQWWDFISYMPDFAPDRRLYVQRVNRDDLYIAAIEAACLSLEEEVCAIVSKIMPERKAA